MTSLDFIMDMDVDKDKDGTQDNKKDGPSSTPGIIRDQDLPASDHAHPGDHQETPYTISKQHRRGNTGRNPRPSTTLTAFEPSATAPPSSSSARPIATAGDSDINNDEMHRYGSHAIASGSGGGGGGEQPNRPMMTPTGEVPIKLTPITGRVSRAKKGVPVHTCEVCRPPKTFTRAEHLRRHQLSHQTPQYPCNYPGCDRAFHRADLLARHAARHEQDGDKASSSRSTPGGNSRRASTTSAHESYHADQSSMSTAGSMPQQPREMTLNRESGYGSGSYHTYNAPGSGPSMSPSQPDNRGSYPPGGASGYTHSQQIPTISPPQGMEDSTELHHYSMPSNYESPRTIPNSDLYIVTSGLGHEGLLAAPDLSPWASSDSNFSTPSRPLIPEFSSPTTSSDWQVNSYVHNYTSSSQGMQSPHLDVMTSSAGLLHDHWGPSSYPAGLMDPSIPMYSEDHFLSHSQPQFPSVRSPTPPNISSSVQSAESLVTLAPAPHDAQVSGARLKGQAALMGSLSGAAFLTAITLPKAAREAIPHFLEVYWKRFDSLFPLVHRRKLELAPDEILRAAMAAVGSQFLDGKEDRSKGNQLHEWAWQEVKRLQILQWNVSTMQTILLCEIFARFRGKKIAIKPSEPFRSLYSRVDTVTQLDLDNSFGSTNSDISLGGLSTATAQRPRWGEWVEAETRRRLLAACFVLDVHTSVYYDLPLMHSFTSPCPPIPLTANSEALWTAASPDRWEALLNAGAATLEPAVLCEGLLSPAVLAHSPPLDRAVFLASEALRVPRKSTESVDWSQPPDLGKVDRVLTLFPGTGVAYTYAALQFTPLHDLLSVSGDSWLFSQKVLEGKDFLRHQKSLKQWSGSLHAAFATKFAAKALIAFLTINDNAAEVTSAGSSATPRRRWNMTDISDYWAIYVCALICWALGHRGTSTTTSNSSQPSTAAASTSRTGGNFSDLGDTSQVERDSELDALGWLHLIAQQNNPQDILTNVQIRGRGVIIAVVAMVRRRLEGEAAGSRSRLLVDAAHVLKKLEQGINWKWF